MRHSICRLYIALSVSSLAFNTACQGADKSNSWPEPNEQLTSFLELPEHGGGVEYLWQKGKNGPEIYGISYGARPDWLVQQKHPQSHWHKLPSLRQIELQMADTLTPEQMKYIASLKTVTELKIHETLFRKGSLAPIANMTWLKKFSLNCNDQLSRLSSDVHDNSQLEHPRGECFKFLEGLTSVEELFLWPVCDEYAYTKICELRNLKKIELGRFPAIIDEKIAARISNLSRLEIVSFQRLESPTPILTGLRDHPTLRELWIDEADLATVDIQIISSIKNLRILYCKGNRVGSLSSLSKNTEMTKLNLHFSKYEASHNFKFLKCLTNLEELVLLDYGKDSHSIADFSLKYLQNHTKLNGLGVYAILQEEEIGILESMRELKKLGVGNFDDSQWCKSARRRLPLVAIQGSIKK